MYEGYIEIRGIEFRFMDQAPVLHQHLGPNHSKVRLVYKDKDNYIDYILEEQKKGDIKKVFKKTLTNTEFEEEIEPIRKRNAELLTFLQKKNLQKK